MHEKPYKLEVPKMFIKWHVSQDFLPLIFSWFEPIWAPDKQQALICSNSVRISLRYSIIIFLRSDSAVWLAKTGKQIRQGSRPRQGNRLRQGNRTNKGNGHTTVETDQDKGTDHVKGNRTRKGHGPWHENTPWQGNGNRPKQDSRQTEQYWKTNQYKEAENTIWPKQINRHVYTDVKSN